MKFNITAVLIATGCVSVNQPSTFPISYVAQDSSRETKIYVKYKNDKERDVCLYPTNWPGNDGRIESGKGRVFISVDAKDYSTADFDSGYCPACVLRVKAGHEAIGFFDYKDFDIPQEDYPKEKSLKFSPMASYCSSRVQK